MSIMRLGNGDFGISLAGCPDPAERDLSGWPATNWFQGLELTGRMLDQPWINHFFARKRLTRVDVTELMPTSITREIAGQRPGIIADFKRQFARMLEQFTALPIDSVTMDCGLDEAAESEEYARKLELFLRGMGLDLYRLKVRLALPVRIPEYRPDYTKFCLELRDRLMLPSLGFTADLYPHELGVDFHPEELLRWLRFDLASVRFFYEPDLGNRLVAKSVSPWLKYLRQIGFSGMVTFCPRVKHADQLLQEADSLRELVSSPEQEVAVTP